MGTGFLGSRGSVPLWVFVATWVFAPRWGFATRDLR